MAKIKRGNPVGKTDANYKDICVGCIVKSRHTGLKYRVTNYGTLQGIDIADIVKKWSGDDYLVVASYGDALAQEIHKEVEEQVRAIDTLAETNKHAADTSVEDKAPEVVPETREESPSSAVEMTDKDLVEELRRRGWEVKCTRTIVEEL